MKYDYKLGSKEFHEKLLASLNNKLSNTTEDDYHYIDMEIKTMPQEFKDVVQKRTTLDSEIISKMHKVHNDSVIKNFIEDDTIDGIVFGNLLSMGSKEQVVLFSKELIKEQLRLNRVEEMIRQNFQRYISMYMSTDKFLENLSLLKNSLENVKEDQMVKDVILQRILLWLNQLEEKLEGRIVKLDGTGY